MQYSSFFIVSLVVFVVVLHVDFAFFPFIQCINNFFFVPEEGIGCLNIFYNFNCSCCLPFCDLCIKFSGLALIYQIINQYRNVWEKIVFRSINYYGLALRAHCSDQSVCPFFICPISLILSPLSPIFTHRVPLGRRCVVTLNHVSMSKVKVIAELFEKSWMLEHVLSSLGPMW